MMKPIYNNNYFINSWINIQFYYSIYKRSLTNLIFKVASSRKPSQKKSEGNIQEKNNKKNHLIASEYDAKRK